MRLSGWIAAVAGALSLGVVKVLAAPGSTPVATVSGKLAGVQASAAVVAYLGVPFAAPPVGALRWRGPASPSPWSGVRRADHFAPACAQAARPPGMGPPSATRSYSEDCLYLNVWSAASKPEARLPVMVWIPGGGFQWGATSDPRFDGAHLAAKGVVVVTLAYRVGPLGFLALPELSRESPHRASGNYGLLDQMAALKWVKANIAAFGGDPSNVTIFGESAGSTSVNILQASPLAKGLFHRVIGESTSQMDDAAGPPGRQTLTQAEQAGLVYEAAVGARSLAELRVLPAAKLTSVTTPFWPVERDGYVLPVDIYTTFATGRQAPAAALLGANADEGAILRQHWIRPATAEERATYAGLYGQEKDPSRASDTDTVLWQMWSWATLNARTPGDTSYFYWFTHFSPPQPGRPPMLAGPVHGAEVVYVFDNLDKDPIGWTAADRQIAEDMSTYWTNFAKTGHPNAGALPHWPKFESAAQQVMVFGDNAHPGALPHQDALMFIDRYFRDRR